jgi:subtilisin-like proprotein convertase family protein
MRQVETEGDTRGVRGRKAGGARPGPSPSRSMLRRASLESLERRELLSTLPTPTLTTAASLVSLQASSTSSANSPSVAVDPVDRQKLAAAWVVHDTTNPLGNGQVTTFVQGAYSVDGGKSWTPLPLPGNLNVQTDFSASQANGPVFFHQTSDVTVAFGRGENILLLSESTTDGSSGVIDLQRYDFSGASPSQTLTNKVVYSWLGNDPASTPTLAVDNNVASFSDVDSKGNAYVQSDPFAGNIYVAWASTDTAPKFPPGNFQPQTIKMVASSNGGADFTHAAFVDDTSNAHQGGSHTGRARYVEPSIAVSQGRPAGALGRQDPGVPGGQVTVVYDDYGTGATAGIPYDQIVTQTDTAGGTDERFNFTPTQPGAGITPINNPAKAAAGPDIPVDTLIPFNVNINDPKFNTLRALDVTLRIAFPNLAKLRAVLEPPAALAARGLPPITLFLNGLDGGGGAVNVNQSLTGVNLGGNSAAGFNFTAGPATVFDQEAVRFISDGSTANPYLGHYKPVGENALLAYQGLTAAQLNGQWTLRITVFQNETGTTGSFVQTAALDFASGNDPGANGGENIVANNLTGIAGTTPNINPLVPGTVITRLNSTGVSADPGRVTTTNVQIPRVLPTPVIASDNTLGAFSQHQGRLYVAYTGRYDGIAGIAKDQTDIILLASDDGGQSWSALNIPGQQNDGVQVNDDNAATDGFSEAIAGTAAGRPQLQPQVAVDPSTGTVVLSFLDTRNDASRARVATYIAASSDGGQTFAPETYANISRTVTDAITGRRVNQGPIPDNQSAGSNQDAFGFGQHQGLAVAGGRIIPVWSSNENLGYKGNGNVRLAIRSSVLTTAGGPRILAGTMGPVGEPGDTVNTTRAADGSPVADTFLLTFDRPIDPATFNPDGPSGAIGSGDVRVYYQDPYGPTTGTYSTPLTGFFATPAFTAPIVLSGHPGVPIIDGQVRVVLTNFADLGRLSVRVLGPNNQVLVIPTAAGTTALDTTVRLPANMLGGAVDGAYVLEVSDSSGGQNGTFQSFSVQLNGLPTPLRVLTVDPIPNPSDPLNNGTLGFTRFRVTFEPIDRTDPSHPIPTGVGTYSYIVRPNLTDRIRTVGKFGTSAGNAMDQNADAGPGQDPETTRFVGLTPGDDFITPSPARRTSTSFAGPGLPVGPYTAGSLPLIVPGPHVINVIANGVGGASSGSTSDHLILNDKVSSVDVVFDRQVQVATITGGQVLSIVGPAGPISGPQTFNSSAVARDFASNDVGRAIPQGGTLVSTLPILGTGLSVSVLRVRVNITDPNDSTLALSLVAPDGTTVPLVAAGSTTGANFSDTTFSDVPGPNGLVVPIGGGRAPYGLTYQPSAAGALAMLRGRVLDGTWKLLITDTSAPGATPGRLNSWSLSATPLVPDGGSLDTRLTIPDNGGSFTIDNLAVRLNIAAPKASDLSAYLVAPDGTVVSLFSFPGGIGAPGADFRGTTLDPNAPIGIQDPGVSAPYNLTYRPLNQPGFATLASLRGRKLEGTWTLRVVDNFRNGLANSATVNAFALVATPRITVSPRDSATVSGVLLASTYRISFPTQQLSGTYAVTLGAGVLGAPPSVFNPSAPGPIAGAPRLGAGADPNLNGGVDVLKGTSPIGALPTTPVIYTATGVPVGIPPASVNGGVLTSSLVVPDNFLVQSSSTGPNGARIAGLTVQLNITYPFDQDLSAVLIAPDGTRINLFTHVGGTTPNFNNTIFDDTVNPPASIRNAGGNQFFGRFNPETPLGTLAGISSAGTWKLEITNTGAIATGSLNRFALTFQKPVPSSGLGDPTADRQTVNFRIFNFAPTNPLANDTWTAVGPAGVTVRAGQQGGFAGPVSTLAYDPSDPTRNTVYVGAASGGIWKTSNFLTSDPAGPTYQPMTDFGPNFSLNVGSIAAFGRSSDPEQTILFAGTGFAQATYPYAGGGPSYPNYGGPAGRGVGLLRSFYGGKDWVLLDSSVNVDAGGNPLPINSTARDHIFVGDTTYKVLVDPTPLPNGNLIVYAALGGPTGGLYRSLDTGATWSLLKGGTATDVVFDPNSRSPSTGNIDIIYAAFQGQGVFISTNRGQNLALLTGQLGRDPLIQGPGFPAAAATVGNAGVTPNGAKGRIVLAKPGLTGNAAEDLLYQDWLFAAVEGPDGRFDGLYVTKDRGQNWTNARLLNLPSPQSSVTPAVPTNDDKQANSYDPTANQPSSNFFRNGNYDLTLTIDPSNPNLVYLGGTQNFQESGLVRVDLTNLRDAHNLVSFANDRNDGGTLTRNSSGGINVSDPINNFPAGVIYNPPNYPRNIPTPYLNFRHAPNSNIPGTSPFDVNGTLVVVGKASSASAGAIDFNNDGTGVKWTLLDEPLKANAGDPVGSSNLHYSTAFVDPLTGNVRLIFGDDQGVFTALLNPDGTLDNGIGNATSANYSRNGNLQNQQFYRGAAQPSSLAAQTAGALFYASGQGLLAVRSDPKILNNGNLNWDGTAVLNPTRNGPRDTAANASIVSGDRAGVGIATDPTGGAGGSGQPAVYEYDVPSLGGNLTDFFRVNDVGRTTGLDNNIPNEFPFGNFRASGTTGNDTPGAAPNGQLPLGNFVVNPLDGSQVLIGSATGVLYETTTTGASFFAIGQPGDFDGTQLTALAYGAPDPSAPGGIGNLNNFLYVGTSGRVGGTPGHIYVSETGGQGYTDISSGLDGASVVSIYPSPDRGSHSAYAVTLNGVFYTPDSLGTGPGGATWVNITGNLTQIQRAPFGDPSLTQAALAPFGSNSGAANQGTAPYGGLRSIVADYRYAVPDPVVADRTYPVLYVGGFGGVFRSLDNGQTWAAFPNMAFDAAPADGGYLPHVLVNDLQLVLGAINPATGRPVQAPSDRPVLMATTFGRGVFAIGLAPDVFPNTIRLDPAQPAPGGSDSGPIRNDRVTNVTRPVIDGISEISNFGNTVTITLIDLDNPDPTTNVLGSGLTDFAGRFSIQVGTFIAGSGQTFRDPSFLTDANPFKHVGVQATDSSGATGNVTTFTYTLDITRPNIPGTPRLQARSDSGRSSSDNLTNVVAPTFDIATGEPASTVINLYRFNPSTNRFDILVGSAQGGVNPTSITDTNFAALIGNKRVYTNLRYQAVQVDRAGNVSDASGILDIAFKNTLPPALGAPSLELGSNSGLDKSKQITNDRNPFFDVAGLESSQSQLFLYRSIGGAAPIQVGFAAVGQTRIRDIAGVPADGTYLYQVVQQDIFGNVSPFGQGTAVTINTQAPPRPTLSLFAADDSGNPTDGITRVQAPRFNGRGTPGLQIVVYALVNNNHANDVAIAETVVSPDGTYLAKSFGPLADGTYNLEARTVNAAGNISYSPPLKVTIKANGPRVVPSLSIIAADDTGIPGDGVTANRRPRFIGRTDPGVTVTLYANGQLDQPQATASSSTLDGSFTIRLPFDLSNGNTQLVVQATDVAGNKGPVSPALGVRIVTVTGDYFNTGRAQFTVFRPTTESYLIRGAGALQVDTTPGRDIPVQYDFNGDGKTDQTAYRFDAAEYFGFLSDGSVFDKQFGRPRVSLPVSGNYDSTGIPRLGLFDPDTATWAINLPTAGGRVVNFGIPRLDIPTPAAFDGGGVTEIAYFRPVNVDGNDADSFSVLAPDSPNNYRVSFTDPAVRNLGFQYLAGDLPAPADYDGVGRDEFAVYRPSTGQFFILNVPTLFDKSKWTLRTVTLNIPGGPKVGDVPASADYEGTGKASPTAFRPSNSTFFEVPTNNTPQQIIQFGQPGLDVAAAGPLLYRLSALSGPYTSSDGYPPSSTGGGGGGSVTASSYSGPGATGRAVSPAGSSSLDASSTSGSDPAALVASSTIALAMPGPVATAPAAAVPIAAPTGWVPPALTPASVGAPASRRIVGTVVPGAGVAHAASRLGTHGSHARKPSAPARAAHHAPATPRSPKVRPAAHQTRHATVADPHQAVVAAALKDLGPIKKGRRGE